MAHILAVGLGLISAGLSSATLATALTGFWIVASPALAGVAAVFGLVSAGFTVVSKRLERKVTKHQNIYTLAVAKLNSVAELVSKALTDKKISDSEFMIILREVQKYRELKAAIRDGEKKMKTENKEPQMPDLDKIKGDLRKEIKTGVPKKDKSTLAVSKSDLNDLTQVSTSIFQRKRPIHCTSNTDSKMYNHFVCQLTDARLMDINKRYN